MAITDEVPTGLIPILDLGPFLSNDASGIAALAGELRGALEDVGFFFIVNHGVPWSDVEAIYRAAADLHALPQAEKDAMLLTRVWGGYLGVGGGTSYASEIAGEVRKPNQNEAFFIHEGGYREGNQYPEIAGFEELTTRYIGQLSDLGESVVRLLALSLDLEENYFAPHFDVPSVTLRMSHYPVMDYSENEWGIAPHTDSSIFTFLPTNDVPGLEIRPAGRPWMTPPVIDEAFLVNSGDMLKRWTNDRFRSTAHRARNASSTERYAIPFFYGARDDAVIDPVPTTVSVTSPSRYEPITYGDYQRWFLSRNYSNVMEETADAKAP